MHPTLPTHSRRQLQIDGENSESHLACGEAFVLDPRFNGPWHISVYGAGRANMRKHALRCLPDSTHARHVGNTDICGGLFAPTEVCFLFPSHMKES